jgi:hypothetical protein
VVVGDVVTVLDVDEVDDEVVEVAASIDVDECGCCAPKESLPVSMANPAAATRMITVAASRFATRPDSRTVGRCRFLLC